MDIARGFDKPNFPVFDCDQHLYETPDALLRHLPSQFDGAVKFVQEGKRTRIAINNKITEYMPNPTFEKVAAPGAHMAYYQAKNVKGQTLREMGGAPINATPAMRGIDARIDLINDQGIQNILCYPTLANLVEHSAQDDPDLVHAIIHSLNQWMAEEWGFFRDERVALTPVITMAIVDEAIRELDWVLEHGAKVILIRPAPTRGLRGFRSPALPEFDPFWAKVEAAGLPVVLHAAQPPLDDYISMWEPTRSNNAFTQSAFKVVALGHRDIQDMLTSLVCHGTLSRFPKLRIASVENGSHWVGPLLESLDEVHGKLPQVFSEHPVDTFKRNVWVSPFWEGNVVQLAGLIGEDRVMFGSDWPHPEGLDEPLSYLKYLDGVSDDLRQRIMSTNAYEFMGITPQSAQG